MEGSPLTSYIYIYILPSCGCASFSNDLWYRSPICPSKFAVAWEGELPCGQWDCVCAFKRHRGCCCAATELQEVEDQIFTRMMDLLASMSQLGASIVEVIGTPGTWTLVEIVHRIKRLQSAYIYIDVTVSFDWTIWCLEAATYLKDGLCWSANWVFTKQTLLLVLVHFASDTGPHSRPEYGLL